MSRELLGLRDNDQSWECMFVEGKVDHIIQDSIIEPVEVVERIKCGEIVQFDHLDPPMKM